MCLIAQQVLNFTSKHHRVYIGDLATLSLLLSSCLIFRDIINKLFILNQRLFPVVIFNNISSGTTVHTDCLKIQSSKRTSQYAYSKLQRQEMYLHFAYYTGGKICNRFTSYLYSKLSRVLCHQQRR